MTLRYYKDTVRIAAQQYGYMWDDDAEVRPYLGFHFEGSIVRTGEWMEVSPTNEFKHFFDHTCVRIIAILEVSGINTPWVYGKVILILILIFAISLCLCACML